MLLAIKNYVQQHPNATVAELGWHFKTTSETIDPILQILQRKGYVKRLSSPTCGDCQSSCHACPLKEASTC